MTPLQGTSILVVGGAGFVGGNLVREALAQEADRVLVVDNLLSAERVNVPDHARVDFVEGSIADDAILDALDDEFDYVFHLATYHGNQSSIADPLADHEHNLITTLKLFDRFKDRSRLRKLVYAASGCTLAEHTYGDAEATTEEGPVPLDLDSPYQISKVVGEFYSVYYHRQHGLPTVRARFQNVYGPGEILGAGRWRGTPATVWRNVTPTFVYRALKGLPLRLDNGGEATRDFIYVGDIVAGLIACAEHGGPGDVYNLASGVETSIRELAETVADLAGGRPDEIELGPPRAWDRSGHRFGSPEKAKRELGFEAAVPLGEGLQRTVDWTRGNLDLIDSCIERHASHMKRAVEATAA
ncbi:MAG: NAD-dependent epimerase/dehydratase family protein [Actinomycetota bacterium]|nr:NAD-dependent epimerase/dehydratase family protein [Actinomycetota bacterium]